MQLDAAASRTSLWGRLELWLVNHEALGTWVIGAATLILAASVIVAWFALRDAKKTRHAELLAEFSLRWDGDDIDDSAALGREFGAQGLAELSDRLYGPKAVDPRASADELQKYRANLADWFKVIRWPNLIETIGVMVRAGALPHRLVYRTWGGTIIEEWRHYWERPAVAHRIHKNDDDAFKYFEWLAKRMERERKWERRRTKLLRRGSTRSVISGAASQDHAAEPADSRATGMAERQEGAQRILSENSSQRALGRLILAGALIVYILRKAQSRR